MNTNNKGFCLNPAHKDRKVANRGLCQTCYKAAGELVKATKTTWEKLEKAGKALAVTVRGPKGSQVKDWLLDETVAAEKFVHSVTDGAGHNQIGQ